MNNITLTRRSLNEVAYAELVFEYGVTTLKIKDVCDIIRMLPVRINSGSAELITADKLAQLVHIIDVQGEHRVEDGTPIRVERVLRSSVDDTLNTYTVVVDDTTVYDINV